MCGDIFFRVMLRTLHSAHLRNHWSRLFVGLIYATYRWVCSEATLVGQREFVDPVGHGMRGGPRNFLLVRWWFLWMVKQPSNLTRSSWKVHGPLPGNCRSRMGYACQLPASVQQPSVRSDRRWFAVSPLLHRNNQNSTENPTHCVTMGQWCPQWPFKQRLALLQPSGINLAFRNSKVPTYPKTRNAKYLDCDECKEVG